MIALKRKEHGVTRAAKTVVPFAVVGLIGVMILPLPALVLDLLISLNIALSMVILLTAVYNKNPIHFSVFPSALLLSTVFRLGLNIASTRRILLHGPEGTSAAGSVIEAFGQFVVGGSMVVGLVIFLVLLAVQFIVINHGANRISEVAARFTLDAMPGKQMAIDADLNAGLIEEAEARSRRERIQEEADFYGAMDGAVKFTQRDAIASLIIVIINIIAGLGIGVLQAGMSALDAVKTFTVLTVGDGLVTAIPALLISVSGAFLTTRSGGDDELAVDLTGQFANTQPLAVAAVSLGALGLIPGLPTFAFLTLACGLGGIAYALHGHEREEQRIADTPAELPAGPPPEEPMEPLLTVDPLTIEVGYDLVEAAGSEATGGLLDRIRGIRRQLAMELGVVVPPVRVRDNLRIAADEYQILLRGAEVGSCRLPRGKVMAIDPGDVLETVEGQKATDPAFGIPALWIDEAQADRARSAGYTVVDRISVMATHLSELVQRHAPELLGRQETQKLLDMLAKHAPKLVEELIPERASVGQVQKVLQALLRERVSIRDLESICETLSDCARPEATTEDLVARVRQGLGRSMLRPLLDQASLNVVTLSSEVEAQLRAMLTAGPGGSPPAADPRVTQTVMNKVANAIRSVPGGVQPAVLCNSAESRLLLRRITQTALPTVPVLAIQEIPDGLRVNAVGRVN